MIVLALDTALTATSVALVDDDQVLSDVVEPMERGHQERLASVVRDTMRAAALGFSAIDRIGVTVGPGSFTGLRVGLAFAKGLALALERPCVGVGTLEALAASIQAAGLVVAVIDARRGGVYLQLFADGRALSAPEALTQEAAVARVRACGFAAVTLVGPGAALLSGDLPSSAVVPVCPDPVSLANLVGRAIEPLEPPRPIYLRAPDAKTRADRGAGST